MFFRHRAREWTVTGFRMISPSLISFRICWPGKSQYTWSVRWALIPPGKTQESKQDMTEARLTSLVFKNGANKGTFYFFPKKNKTKKPSILLDANSTQNIHIWGYVIKIVYRYDLVLQILLHLLATSLKFLSTYYNTTNPNRKRISLILTKIPAKLSSAPEASHRPICTLP